ncbi:MAG: hypothetical protein CVU49_08265 [Candidatus Cloacimonetes bacterium HGW-Cloacimonetes-2]|nr:MAG: hypothetical protein CVU49_08265 [Candidatus Cloacimonetes bacterium HGW-Cloacimonetes-2]
MKLGDSGKPHLLFVKIINAGEAGLEEDLDQILLSILFGDVFEAFGILIQEGFDPIAFKILA